MGFSVIAQNDGSAPEEKLLPNQAINDSTDEKIENRIDSLYHQVTSDTISNNELDSLRLEADSLSNDTSAKTTKGDIETVIDYDAKDSILFDLNNQMLYLYGDSKVVYGDISLEAERIDLDWTQNLVAANYVLDSTGRKKGKPLFTDRSDAYETDDMKYNFKSKKAIINGIITKQDGAIMHGQRVKKNEKNEMFVRDAKYTTCDLAEPHFHIKAKKLKVIPNKKVLSGPFNLYFGEIPTILGFPFGMFPSTTSKSSGIIFPSYGEELARGFFLRDFGYYFNISEYIDLKVTADVFSRGSYGIRTASTYKKRYKFRGNFNVKYDKIVSTNFEDDSFSKVFWVNWSHSPQSKGNSRFSASVNAGSSSFNANTNNITQNFTNSVSSSFSSNISFSHNFKGTPFSLSMSARHSQNVSTGIANLSLPELSVSATRIQPFAKSEKFKKTPLGKLGFSYRMDVRNSMTNTAPSIPSYVINDKEEAQKEVSFSSDNISILMDRGKQGMQHVIPISTSFNILGKLTVSPSINYREVWYLKELQYSEVWENNNYQGVRVDTLRKFSRTGWYSTGVGTSTQLYGFYPIGGKKIEAIRHMMTPSISFSYSPDFTDGNYTEVQTSESGTTRQLSKYQGFAYGSAPTGQNASMSFGINNSLEMKVKTKKDSVNSTKKIKLLENLSFRSGYNFLADSFNLSNISMSARTTLFDKLINVSVGGTLDPYTYILDSTSSSGTVYQRRINRYTWNNGDGLGNLKSFNFALSFNLSPKNKKGTREEPGMSDSEFVDPFDEEETARLEEENFMSYDPNLYVPFEMPWTFRANYTYTYSKTGFRESRVNQSLSFSGSVLLTKNTDVSFNSGYDFEQKEFTVTRINLSRKLHCWTMSFNWVPFGPQQSYFVNIQVNSSLLKDLKLDKRGRSTYFR